MDPEISWVLGGVLDVWLVVTPVRHTEMYTISVGSIAL